MQLTQILTDYNSLATNCVTVFPFRAPSKVRNPFLTLEIKEIRKKVSGTILSLKKNTH